MPELFGDRLVQDQHPSIDPNDPNFKDQWNLHMMGVQNAWRFTTGSDSVLVGVQDSGLGVVDGNFHPDLGTTIHYSDNVADEFSSNSSHGTGVQGIIAAETNNGTGVAGINWNSDVFNIDVLSGNDFGDMSLTEATRSMIDYANSQGQQLVINMSLGAKESFGVNYHSDLEGVVANNPNTLFVIAAGNDGHLGQIGISSPAILAQSYDNVIAVGASWGTNDKDGNPTQFIGQRIQYNGQNGWGSQYGLGLTLMGPSEVLSTGAFLDRGFDYHTDFNGTSAAAPNVAGVASLVWSANPDLSAAGIRYILSETAYDLGYEGNDLEYGHGFVNADAAVRRAMALSSSESQSSTLSSDDFSTASYSSYSSNEADISSFTGSDLDNQMTLEEDLIFSTEEAYGNISLDSLENSAISFGTTSDFGAITALSDSFSEGLSYDSSFAISNGLGEENVFSSAVEI